MLRIRSILHPTDFSAPSEYAFHLACLLAQDHQSRVTVLHVAELPLVAPAGTMNPPPPGGVWEAIDAELHKFEAADPAIRVEHRLEKGNPAKEILQVAQQIKCDLIVLGSHGHTGLARLLMGSVAEQVVRKAACPVLVVKRPFPAEEAG